MSAVNVAFVLIGTDHSTRLGCMLNSVLQSGPNVNLLRPSYTLLSSTLTLSSCELGKFYNCQPQNVSCNINGYAAGGRCEWENNFFATILRRVFGLLSHLISLYQKHNVKIHTSEEFLHRFRMVIAQLTTKLLLLICTVNIPLYVFDWPECSATIKFLSWPAKRRERQANENPVVFKFIYWNASKLRLIYDAPFNN